LIFPELYPDGFFVVPQSAVCLMVWSMLPYHVVLPGTEQLLASNSCRESHMSGAGLKPQHNVAPSLLSLPYSSLGACSPKESWMHRYNFCCCCFGF